MSIARLEEFGGYAGINEGVHRKAAPLIGHPSLTWHLGLWDVNPLPDDRRCAAISKYFSDLKDQLNQSPDCTNVDLKPGVEVAAHDRGRINTFTFRWHGLPVTIRFETSTEYVTCTSIIDLSAQPDAAAVKPDGSKIAEAICTLRRLLCTHDKGDEVGAEALKQAHAAIYMATWETFENAVLDPHAICDATLGKVFADFRGFVTGDVFHAEAPCDPVQGEGPFQSPFRKPSTDRGRTHINRRMSDEWARKVVHRIWPFMSIGAERSEFTVSRFVDGRVIYVSTLGQEVPTANSPVCYYAHACTDDEWQIGRLLDRLHTMGTLRLAASIQLNDLSRAGSALKGIEGAIEALRRQISDHLSVELSGQQGYALAQVEREKIRVNFRALVDSINKMNQAFEGNIEERISQAQYYIEKFKADCPYLRSRRLEGYQPYPEFVLRRLGGSFSFIDLMSERFQTYRANMALLQSSYLSLDLSVATHGIDESIRQNTLTQSRLEQQGDVIRDIQDFGEIVLICVIAPHYFFEIIIRLFASHPAAGAPDAVASEGTVQILILPAIIFGSCLIAAARVIFSMRKAMSLASSSKNRLVEGEASQPDPAAHQLTEADAVRGGAGSQQLAKPLGITSGDVWNIIRVSWSYKLKFTAIFAIAALSVFGAVIQIGRTPQNRAPTQAQQSRAQTLPPRVGGQPGPAPSRGRLDRERPSPKP